MDPTRAKDILKSLADGRDPATGEPFAPGSPYQQADTVRALYMALEALSSAPSAPPRERSPRSIDPNRPKLGTAWSPEEEQQLRDEFAAHKTESENLPFKAKEASFADWRSRVAQAHGRTAGAITARLVKLGLIEDTAANRAGLSRRSPMGAETDAPPPLTEQEKDNLPF